MSIDLLKLKNKEHKEIIKTSNIVIVEKQQRRLLKNAKMGCRKLASPIPKMKNLRDPNRLHGGPLLLVSNVVFQYEGGWIIQIGDSETAKELLEATEKHVIDNVYDGSFDEIRKKNNKELIDCTDKYVVGNFLGFRGEKESVTTPVTIETIISIQKKDGSFETNEKITKVSLPQMTLLHRFKTSPLMTNSNLLIPPSAPTTSIFNQNSNRKRILDASNNYVIDELTQEVIDIKKGRRNLEFEDSDDDLDEMDKKYLT
ncbi:hypothetical protein Glove_52g24 [Diversispora epigaea]|uniref:Uncharacterized protein n=1 Tax=Diversispora epigaea TaxID=1348612 RepID=A0A397JN05_9GLOM|nr:hypothetical protein Glove_52g24 [Diversispora epigaea]